MGTLLIALAAGLGFIVAYNTYGRWLGRKIFELSIDNRCPSETMRDDQDYVPTPTPIVFGHHFTSIAGTGPIVGPAIAVIWGWLPALLWVIFGSILIGAVHDMGSLVVSLRSRGKSVGDIAGRVINPRVRLLFLFVLFMALNIVLAIFGLVIASVFKIFPATILPCVIQIPLAIAIGIYLHRKGVGLLLPSLVALGLMYATVFLGDVGVLHTINEAMAAWPVIVWVVVLLVYSYIASVLPVWVLLQPRDYINSLQLLSAMGLVMLGLVVAAFIGGSPQGESTVRPALEIVAPMVQWSPEGAPSMVPFLFITIACGAISGFHCLVSSGTSSKQLCRETDATFVGYGSMVTEGFLATLVILACVAGLGLGVVAKDGTLLQGADAWAARYSSWGAADGLGAKIGAFVDGAANFLGAIGMPRAAAVALMGVFVASFAGTTLDTACRLQRYVVQELASTCFHLTRRRTNDGDADSQGRGPGAEAGDALPAVPLFRAGTVPLSANPLSWLTNKHGATLFAIAIARVMAAFPPPGVPWSWDNAGKGGMLLWPMFGATNQLLGGLAFMVIAFYLWRRKKPVYFLVLPMIFMLVMPAWALIPQLHEWLNPPAGVSPNYILIAVAGLTLMLEVWMVIEAILLWPKVRGELEGVDLEG